MGTYTPFSTEAQERDTQPSPRLPIKIEAVMCCVGYADILAHTLPLNKQHFDRLIVVTSPSDAATAEVCKYYGVECVRTDAFQSQWAGTFRKGAGINVGFSKLDFTGWVLHLDADIVLPPNFREFLERADLDPTMIYGVDRAEFRNFQDWQRFHQSPVSPVQAGGFVIDVEHHGQRFGARVQMQHAGGWIPIGFFQLFHAESGVREYEAGHTDAGREDSIFAMRWPRRKRALIPEIVVFHLESEAAPMGANWKGRTTKPFGIAAQI